jgi:uncharacterized protein YraI
MAAKKTNKATFNYGGVQLSLTKSKTQAAVQYTPGAKKTSSKRKAASAQQIENFEVIKAKRNLNQKLDELRAKPEVAVGTHVWNVGEGDDTPFIPTGNLYIEFKPGTDDEKQRTLMDELHLNVFDIVHADAYRVSVTPSSPNPIKCVMLLQKQKIVLIAEPEFVTKPVTSDFAPPGGRFIATQWHLENTGDRIPVIEDPNGVYGTSHFKKGADAKVKEAWTFLGNLGSKFLKIAVIDTGFATDHPQLRGDGTKIRNAFHAAERHNDVSPLFQYSDGSWGVFSHGTSCAAVAAGAWDPQGILGAAPNSKIIPIKLDILSDAAIKNAFEHALLNGADIISCSLGFPKPVPLSTFISNYLNKVAREGRGGKGIPMFFAAGNANPASDDKPRQISDFANHPEGICVTASNSLDEPSDYSFFGTNAFLCAPTNGNDGVGITTAMVDVDGNGRLLLQYTSGFGGTSSATPLAAGICALMLTANPNLTLNEIKSILRQTTDKIGSGYNANGHSQFLGYGRINALKAVRMAAQMAGGGSVPATPTKPAPSATQRGKVVSKFLNVRSGPGTSNPKVAELKQGDLVNLFEKAAGWWRIGQGQFVSGDFVQVLAANSSPVTTRKGKVTSSFLNVRSGPGTNNPKIAELKQGALVTIFETSSNGWHRIGQGQWVIGTNIQEL